MQMKIEIQCLINYVMKKKAKTFGLGIIYNILELYVFLYLLFCRRDTIGKEVHIYPERCDIS